jgi:hypothetical protein
LHKFSTKVTGCLYKLVTPKIEMFHFLNRHNSHCAMSVRQVRSAGRLKAANLRPIEQHAAPASVWFF